MISRINNFLIPLSLGIIAVFIHRGLQIFVLDTLVLAMLFGIIFRFFVKVDDSAKQFFVSISIVFILIGILFYGALNLNFQKVSGYDPLLVFLLLFIFIIYLISLLLLSGIFRLPSKIAYLITAGSVVCGASAIAITSKSVDADPDEISISLLAVFCAALAGIFCIFPICRFLGNVDGRIFAGLSGSVLQFTGFVKTAAACLPEELRDLALGLKSMRYLTLLLIIPLFASFERKVFFFPGYLIMFVFAGGFFSVVTEYNAILFPIFKDILDVLWAVAMAAIGLSVDIKNMNITIFLKAFFVSFMSFCIAVGVYLIGYSVLFNF